MPAIIPDYHKNITDKTKPSRVVFFPNLQQTIALAVHPEFLPFPNINSM